MPVATNLYVLADAPSVTNALRLSLFQPTTGTQFPDSILGDSRLVNLYLITSAGAYDSRSGAAAVAPRLAIARKNKAPTSGTFTLTFGANTTPDLAYNIAAPALETALNALASVVSAGGLDVTGATGGPYTIFFRTNGARALLTGNAIDLLPSSGLAVNNVVTGDGSTRAVQAIRIQTRVVALTETWTQLLDGATPIGWQGTLSTNTVDVLEMLEGSTEVDATVEVEVTEAGAKTTLMQQAAKIRYDVINDGSTAPLVVVAFATIADINAANAQEFTLPTALAITAAGNSNLAAPNTRNRYLTQRINVTAGSYTATITLQNTSALAGDKRRFIVSMPASATTVIQFRNLTSGGTLLGTVPVDAAVARTWVGYSTYDGTNWGAVSMSPQGVEEYVTGSRVAQTAALIEAQGLAFDGTNVALFDIFAFGNSAWYLSGIVKVSSLAGVNTIVSGSPSTSDVSTYVYVDMDGTITVGRPGVGTVHKSTATVAAGVPTPFAVVYNGTTIVLTVNGVSNSITVTLPNQTSAWNRLGAFFWTSSLGGPNTNVSLLNGTLASVRVGNYAPTLAEIQALTARGLVTLPEQRGGSMVALNTSNFAADPNDGAAVYDTFTGLSPTGFTAATAAAAYRSCAAAPVIFISLGRRYLVRFTATLTSGQAPSMVLTKSGTADYSAVNTVTAGSNSFVLTALGNQAAAYIRFSTNVASSYAVSGFSIIPLGTLYELGDCSRESGYQVRDTSGNNLHTMLPATGVSRVSNQGVKGFAYGTLTWSATHEAKSLLGQIAIPSGAVIERVTLTPTASTSGSGITVGTTNSATRYVAATAGVANTARSFSGSQLANQTPAGAAAGDLDIVVDPDTANYTGSIVVKVEYSTL